MCHYPARSGQSHIRHLLYKLLLMVQQLSLLDLLHLFESEEIRSQLPGTTLPSTMDTTASVLDVDSSDDMVMKLVEELRKMISDLEDDNRLLRTKLVQEKLNNLTKIGTLQDKVKEMQQALKSSESKIESLAKNLDDEQYKERVTVLNVGETQNIHDGLLSYSRGEDSDTITSVRLIPESWIQFRQDTQSLKLRLGNEPYMALKHKTYSSELQDLVQGVSTKSNRYFVSRSAVSEALKNSNTYCSYTIKVFEDVFDHEVALHCRCDVPYLEPNTVDDILPTLPEEALDVFMGHCITVAREFFKAVDIGERRVRANLTACINVHLDKMRARSGVGQLEDYKWAMRMARKAKFAY